jgi:hypothetical protein
MQLNRIDPAAYQCEEFLKLMGLLIDMNESPTYGQKNFYYD